MITRQWSRMLLQVRVHSHLYRIERDRRSAGRLNGCKLEPR
jgi:hypothetical protein